jgi:hypothetical protein
MYKLLICILIIILTSCAGEVGKSNKLTIPEGPSEGQMYLYGNTISLSWQDNSNNELGFHIVLWVEVFGESIYTNIPKECTYEYPFKNIYSRYVCNYYTSIDGLIIDVPWFEGYNNYKFVSFMVYAYDKKPGKGIIESDTYADDLCFYYSKCN